MKTTLYHLRARSPFHFGVRGVGIEETADHAESDTLFSALCQTLRLVEGRSKLEQFLEKCLTDPPFLLSGAYPFAAVENGIIRFYPSPLTLQNETRSREHKKLVKAKWISENLFDFIITSTANSGAWLKNAVYLPTVDAIVTQKEHESLLNAYGISDPALWKISDVPRVAIDRITNASAVFQNGRLSFAPGNGLWCMVAWRNTTHFNAESISKLLRELGDSGLGGERSGGNGQFDLIAVQNGREIEIPALGQRFVTLGLYHPKGTEREVFQENLSNSYALITRRGWISSPESSSRKRKSVRMVAAGSVLTSIGQEVYGSLVDVTPDPDSETGARFPHAVYRWGYALPIKLQ